MKNLKKTLTLCSVMVALAACSFSQEKMQQNLFNAQQKSLNAEIIVPENPNMIRTPQGANLLDLETPLRCQVNWTSQNLISTIPYNLKAFNLVANGNNDLLPRFEVTGFSFDTMPAEKALYKLTKEANIRLIAKDGPYPSISAENLRGEFSDVVKMITEAAEIYYTYDAHNKTMKLSKKANFSLFVPQSKPIMLALLDVLRGAGITEVTTDWDDYSITFDADYDLRNQIMQLIGYFEENPTLIAFDVSIYRIYPLNYSNKDNGIEWQNLLKDFDFGSVKSAKTGIIGRVLTTSDVINIATLQQFLNKQATVVPVAEGKFIVPNLWLSRFDIGKCGNAQSIERSLSILAKASLEQNHKIFSDITLDTTEGEASRFSVRSKLGENILIIGVPNELFGLTSGAKSETVIFMVPKIIRTTKTSKHLQNNL